LRYLGVGCTNSLIILSFKMVLAVEIIRKCWIMAISLRAQRESRIYE